MNSQSHSILYQSSSIIKDFGLLVKFRLSLMVVFSSAATYLIFANNQFNSTEFYLLTLGGMFITFAANALNQAIERDYDKLMERTANRPIAAGRMNLSTAILLAGICMVAGILLLVAISPLCATLGMISLVLYAFIYTPVKRISTIAVPIGAIPGALPTLIAAVAAQNGITVEALCFFSIQYLWQFPHFWAIAFLGHKDYVNAGFKLIKDIEGEPDPRFGIYSGIYSALGILFLFPLYQILNIHPVIFGLLLISMIVFSYFGIQLYKKNDRIAARKLMFYSIIYLPLIFIFFIINNYIQ